MEGEPIGDLMSGVLENVGSLQSGELDTIDVDELARENQELIDSFEPPVIEKENGEKEIISIGNPADVVNSQRGIGALNLAIRDKSSISTARVNIQDYASLIFDQYYYEKCSRYGAELEKSLLKYQLEYLAYGQESDYANLEKMARTLLFWRQASNMLYLFGCEAKVSEADILASALSIILFLPELKDPIKYSILFAWTFAETISDLRILLSGMADVIEMDVRRTDGNGSFMLDYCVDIIRAELEIGTRLGYEASIERIYGYER